MIDVIALVYASKRISLEDFHAIGRAGALQMERDVETAHDLSPISIQCFDSPEAAPTDNQILFVDAPDDPGALGYHSETPAGKKYGRVFANPILDNGGSVLTGPDSVSAVATHEIIELALDPACNLWVQGPRIAQGDLYAREGCDPVQGDAYPLDLGDGVVVWVSNFVLAAYWDGATPDGAKVDFMGTAPGAFQLAPGGYMVVRDGRGSEREVFHAHVAPPTWRLTTKKHPAARSARRHG